MGEGWMDGRTMRLSVEEAIMLMGRRGRGCGQSSHSFVETTDNGTVCRGGFFKKVGEARGLDKFMHEGASRRSP